MACADDLAACRATVKVLLAQAKSRKKRYQGVIAVLLLAIVGIYAFM